MADSHGHEASPFWAAIGKVSVVIGFLLGLFTLYHAVRPNEPKLTCDCQPAVFDARSIYASLRQSLETQRKNADAFQIEKMLRDAGVAATGQNRSTIPEVSRALADTAWPPSQASVLDQLTQRRAIVDCLLRNEGSRQATDAVLKLPFLIGGVTIDGTLAPQETYAGNTVKLGVVRPRDTAKLYVWSKSSEPVFWSEKDFLLTSAEGPGDVRLAKTSYGVVAGVASFLDALRDSPLVAFGLLLIFVLLLLPPLARAINARRHSHPHPIDQPPEDNGAG